MVMLLASACMFSFVAGTIVGALWENYRLGAEVSDLMEMSERDRGPGIGG